MALLKDVSELFDCRAEVNTHVCCHMKGFCAYSEQHNSPTSTDTRNVDSVIEDLHFQCSELEVASHLWWLSWDSTSLDDVAGLCVAVRSSVFVHCHTDKIIQ